jgi:mRNA interferase RelE/StbE
VGDRRYRLDIAPAALRALAKLAPPDQRRIRRAIDDLESDPRPPGALLLAGAARRLWRLRVGDYRVIYEIRDDVLVVLVIRIGHRREVYRER